PTLPEERPAHRVTVLANTWQGESPGRISRPTETSARRRSAHFRRTATPPRHDRQRVGMDHRLVCAQAPCRSHESLLRPAQPTPAQGRRQRRSMPAGDQDSAQGDQGGLASLRAELLPPVSAGRALPRAGGHVNLPPRFSLHRPPVVRRVMAKTDKPNILVIWGDDIGITNLSCYSRGLMGYRTPNIDRLANEGMCFTDAYGEQSCTAGRSSFITGQSVFRTGLSKVGIPAAPIGLQAEDATIAELLKPLGYATGQFGKNHLGDLNMFLPTVHGFDEFFGNLYHLNAEEVPED